VNVHNRLLTIATDIDVSGKRAFSHQAEAPITYTCHQI